MPEDCTHKGRRTYTLGSTHTKLERSDGSLAASDGSAPRRPIMQATGAGVRGQAKRAADAVKTRCRENATLTYCENAVSHHFISYTLLMPTQP